MSKKGVIGGRRWCFFGKGAGVAPGLCTSVILVLMAGSCSTAKRETTERKAPTPPVVKSAPAGALSTSVAEVPAEPAPEPAPRPVAKAPSPPPPPPPPPAPVAKESAPEPEPEPEPKDEWISLFDGKSLDGWKASENKGTFTVQDGEIVAKGKRSHLFYVGPVNNHDFKNFEFKADVLTKPRANAGLYFHTKYQERGWPGKGYEVQVNNTHKDWRKTASLYGIKDVRQAPAKDHVWFTEQIIVNGKRIITMVDGKVIVDYTEPEDVKRGGRVLSSGTFAIQGHDPGSEVHFKNIMVKPLPD